ncbi:eCIS core domain-containing protein [Candidatus Nitrosotalea sp. TS]|uniref:eCIS core domain-containing protein n=1 Tax=Candidatus Nitrosotalea sp. TS TaxID=2341020 RepID=UPI00140D7031|nr:DUF4157 domain-containing protein [Candidatus Nitrosotalea sp. TS]
MSSRDTKKVSSSNGKITAGSKSKKSKRVTNPILSLQRKIGNQAVIKLANNAIVQTKLTVSHPSDAAEQEADTVAKKVMKMDDASIQRKQSELQVMRDDNMDEEKCKTCLSSHLSAPPSTSTSTSTEPTSTSTTSTNLHQHLQHPRNLHQRPTTSTEPTSSSSYSTTSSSSQDEKEIMSMADPSIQRKQSELQVMRSGPEEEEPLQRKIMRSGPEEELLQKKIMRSGPEEELLQGKSNTQQSHHSSGNHPDPGQGFETSLNSSRGGGSNLDGGAREFLEPRFESDFSDVRVHTDSNAAKLSREVAAKAFTVGRDIYFSQGAYDPSSNPGKELLAHELTHVKQQTGI